MPRNPDRSTRVNLGLAASLLLLFVSLPERLNTSEICNLLPSVPGSGITITEDQSCA
jgi:hypothetical protein